MSKPPIVMRVTPLEMPVSDDPAVLRQEIAYLRRYGAMPIAARLDQLTAALAKATSSPRKSGQLKHLRGSNVEHGSNSTED